MIAISPLLHSIFFSFLQTWRDFATLKLHLRDFDFHFFAFMHC